MDKIMIKLSLNPFINPDCLMNGLEKIRYKTIKSSLIGNNQKSFRFQQGL